MTMVNTTQGCHFSILRDERSVALSDGPARERITEGIKALVWVICRGVVMVATAAPGAVTVRVLPDGPPMLFDGSRTVVIGRDRQADVVVAEPKASRQHLALHYVADTGWVLEDRSTNGTFREGQRVARLVLEGPVEVHLGHAVDSVRVLIQPVGFDATRVARPGMFSTVYDPAPRIRIGRSLDNDIVVRDLLVSRHHAELRSVQDGYVIVDLQSHNGTYVNGRRVHRERLDEGALVAIGHNLLRLQGGRLEEYVDTGQVSFAALDLTVLVSGRTLLDEVGFALDAGDFLAVLGPTGSGKSTLLKALTGTRPADRGVVLYNGRDLYAGYPELRNRIGYVPQDDILHPQLTVRSALNYVARLRFPPDVRDEERDRRVDEVMAELGLTERANLQVAKLSGGQRKRTSVAIELLTKPSLLLLDEPTSGLDPGYEKSVMELLRDLADGGRTVVTVTHSIQSLDRCDRILFLAPGGQTAYFGPPDETLDFFGQPQYADVFQRLDRTEPGFAKQAFLGSPVEQRYLRAPLETHRARAAQGLDAAASATAPVNRRWQHQLSTLVRRYLSVTLSDGRNTALLFLQAPVLGLLMLAVLGRGNLAPGPAAQGKAGTVLVALVLSATYLGATNAIREIVKERPILMRERAVGLSPSAYVLSKVVVLGALTVLQSLVLVWLGVLRQQGLRHGALLTSGWFELFFVVALSGLAAMALGLLISALVSNADKALTILPVILFTEFLLTGAVFSVRGTPVLAQLSYLASARWGYSAAASTADLDAIMGPSGDGAHAHTGPAWTGDITLLLILTAAALLGTWLAIRPLGRPKRR
jgi:ABC-type multidrug transport system ATPase subunit/pSer/pThr/pTyr-binding forkhead associated (FHA) protein